MMRQDLAQTAAAGNATPRFARRLRQLQWTGYDGQLRLSS